MELPATSMHDGPSLYVIGSGVPQWQSGGAGRSRTTPASVRQHLNGGYVVVAVRTRSPIRGIALASCSRCAIISSVFAAKQRREHMLRLCRW
ncbi:MAG TPA: hypothetical protein VFV83_06645 [Chthoniobacteraceae bacterium]|nr:hypothetical protein [Chthoniobacteraceae bacterium]